MADQLRRHQHHHQHRPHRLSLPPRTANPTSPVTSRNHNLLLYPPLTPTPTPSKQRISSLSYLPNKSATRTTSFSFLFLLLFSLRSLYSLLPFLRSSPASFSVFPFSFLVSLLSFLLTLFFFLFTSSSSYSKVSPFQQKLHQPILSLTSITRSQLRVLLAKSLLLAIVFLLRFQALRYCGAAAMILAELSGNVAVRLITGGRNHNLIRRGFGSSKVRGLCALFLGLFLLSISWDRIDCFPLSSVNFHRFGFSMLPSENCLRIWPMLLPFLSGFLGCYEQISVNPVTIRELGRKRIRLISLFFTTFWLFIPAVVSMLVFEAEGDSVSIRNLGWPLANTVLFGVLLSENCSTDEKLISSKDFNREFLVTFVCTLVLELFYFPELSLWGLLVCGLLLWFAVRELDSLHSNFPELGLDSVDTFATSIMKPIRHILSERKSRKIALFLMINAGYMVVEFVAGFMSNSLGLISDACHMLFDCAALAIGLYASYISRLPANSQFNYGRGRFEVLSGYTNAVFLVLVGALIVLESFERILDPQEISTGSLLTVSIGGLLVNMIGLIFFHEEHHHAHGGSGTCSHSHSHSHSHEHSDHKHHEHGSTGHDLKNHSKHQECISVVHDSQQISCSGHEHHKGSKPHCTENAGSESTQGHNHDPGHHHDHHHHHQHSDHEHHKSNEPHYMDNSESEITLTQRHNHDHRHHHDHHHHHHHHSDHDHHISNEPHHTDYLESESTQCHNHDHGHDHDHHQRHNTSHHTHHHHSTSHHTSEKVSSSSSRSDYGELTAGNSCIIGDSHCHDHNKQLSDREEPQKHHHHHHIDHNMEGIFLHVLADTLGSVGVVISTLLIKYWGWLVADPACSIFISVLIVSSVIPLLRNSAEILLQRVPRAYEHDLKAALKNVFKIKGVCGIQHFHVWSFTNEDVVGTLHLHLSTDADKASAKAQVSHLLHGAGIKDLTIQVLNV